MAGLRQGVRPLAREVATEGRVEGSPAGHGALVATFAHDPPLAATDISEPQGGEFAQADALIPTRRLTLRRVIPTI